MKTLQHLTPLPQLRELRLLQELEKTALVSQRDLAIRSGMALGATNTCLRRMAERGWIQVRNTNGRRREYYLTQGGISEKERLVSEMISRAVEHYAWIKGLMRGKLLEMQNAGIRRVAFFGVSHETEIAYTTLQGLNLKLVGIIEDGGAMSLKELFGFEVTAIQDVRTLAADGILVTSLSGWEECIRRLGEYIETSSVMILSTSGGK
jgi:DNA-binding MarR family transcriptional regulator